MTQFFLNECYAIIMAFSLGFGWRLGGGLGGERQGAFNVGFGAFVALSIAGAFGHLHA